MGARVCPVCGRREGDPSARFCDVDGAALVPEGAPGARPGRGAAHAQAGWVTGALAALGLALLGIAAWLVSGLGSDLSGGDVSVDIDLDAPLAARPAAVPDLLTRCYGPSTPGLPVRGEGRAEAAFGRTKELARLGMGMGGAARPVTLAEEEEIGAALEEQLVAQAGRSTQRGALRRLDRAAAALVPWAPRRDELRYTFTLLASRQVNALMGPGGHSLFFQGLLDATQDDDALFMIVGHELAHSELRHATDKLSVMLAAQELGQVILGPDGAELGRLGSTLGTQLVSAVYDQDQEYEADRLGLCLAWLSGARSDSGVRAMDALLSASHGRARAPESGAVRVAYDVISSHPPLPDRRSWLDALAAVIDREGRR